jgi:two-component system, NtrC family, nitrogen regulation sensor histidine kinase NtrY
MILNRFFINIVIRVILIVLSGVVFGIAVQNLDHGYYYTLTGIIILIILQTYLLVNLVNKTNSDLEKFFSSLQDHDSSIRFSDITKSSSFSKLHERMNYLNSLIQKTKIENERTGQFLQSIVDHVDVGLMAFDSSGKIEIYNRAARKYLNTNQPLNLSLLETTNNEIFKIVNSIRPGQEILHKMKRENISQSILVKSSELKFENNTIKLISFQDLTNELDKKELDSWQRLIRVLTHEIMNSISPVTSLAGVISGYFKKKGNGDPLPAENIDNTIVAKTLSGLNTIEETGKGLLDFVDKYRSLTSLPKPSISNFRVESLFQKCIILMESNIPGNIKLLASCNPADLRLEADFSQIEQILINLVKNSVQAIPGTTNGVIELKAFSAENRTIIQVEDNGSGISNEIIENIFVPFYTTKEYGSGIGLSLSRQIMQNHNGTISVSSSIGNGAIFSLNFQ